MLKVGRRHVEDLWADLEQKNVSLVAMDMQERRITSKGKKRPSLL